MRWSSSGRRPSRSCRSPSSRERATGATTAWDSSRRPPRTEVREAFKRLVDAAHRHGLGVILDVVYNHLGPEGNYLGAVTAGRFFTDRHHTPWGEAINYDGRDSGPVRDFVIQNARYWAHEYHVDGLRLDATHAIVDESPVHILRELADTLHTLERPRLVIAEDERDEPRLILPVERWRVWSRRGMGRRSASPVTPTHGRRS